MAFASTLPDTQLENLLKAFAKQMNQPKPYYACGLVLMIVARKMHAAAIDRDTNEQHEEFLTVSKLCVLFMCMYSSYNTKTLTTASVTQVLTAYTEEADPVFIRAAVLDVLRLMIKEKSLPAGNSFALQTATQASIDTTATDFDRFHNDASLLDSIGDDTRVSPDKLPWFALKDECEVIDWTTKSALKLGPDEHQLLHMLLDKQAVVGWHRSLRKRSPVVDESKTRCDICYSSEKRDPVVT